MIEPKVEISDEMSANYFAAWEGIRMRDLGPPEQRLLEVFLQLSFLMGKKEARVASFQKLAESSYLHKGNLRRYIDSLIKAEIVIERYEDGYFYFEVKPDFEQWRVRRRHTHQEEAEASSALQWLMSAPDPNQLELIERPADLSAEVSRAFASTTQPRIETVASSPVPAARSETECDYRPAIVGFDEQMDRLERAVPDVSGHRNWWRKHAGMDRTRLNALRQTIDDYTTNRDKVKIPIAWIIATFKNKVRALVKVEQS
jgi:hypothetical protein